MFNYGHWDAKTKCLDQNTRQTRGFCNLIKIDAGYRVEQIIKNKADVKPIHKLNRINYMTFPDKQLINDGGKVAFEKKDQHPVFHRRLPYQINKRNQSKDKKKF